MAISPDVLGKFLKLLKDVLGDEWHIIASPFLPSELVIKDEGTFLYNFDMKQMDIDELTKLIEGKE